MPLGLGAFLSPERTTRFLRAPHVHFPRAMAAFGWTLVVTSLVLVVLPWRVHKRFAEPVLPRFTRQLRLIGATATLGGLAIQAVLLRPEQP